MNLVTKMMHRFRMFFAPRIFGMDVSKDGTGVVVVEARALDRHIYVTRVHTVKLPVRTTSTIMTHKRS